MAISQNARFSGDAPPDDKFEHPPGASIARLLGNALIERGWKVSGIENWRDGGWSVLCCRLPWKLELVIAKMAVGVEWFLQIAPTYIPWLVGRLLNRPASATVDAIQVLAEDVFDILSRTGRFGDFMWRWDGPPEPGRSTPRPVRVSGVR